MFGIGEMHEPGWYLWGMHKFTYRGTPDAQVEQKEKVPSGQCMMLPVYHVECDY